MIEYQKDYMVRPSLYSRDIAVNHRQRNQKILERLINMRNQLKVLSALLERGELRLNPIYDMYDFSGRLEYQDSRRVRTHVAQGILGTSVTGGGGSYIFSPEVQNFVDNHLEALIQILHNSF